MLCEATFLRFLSKRQRPHRTLPLFMCLLCQRTLQRATCFHPQPDAESDAVYWIAGGALGALLGPVLPFPTEGIDFTLTALFRFLLRKLKKGRIVSLAAGVLAFAALIAAIFIPSYGSELYGLLLMQAIFLLLGTLLTGAVLRLLRRKKKAGSPSAQSAPLDKAADEKAVSGEEERF